MLDGLGAWSVHQKRLRPLRLARDRQFRAYRELTGRNPSPQRPMATRSLASKA